MHENWAHFYDAETKLQSTEWIHSCSIRPNTLGIQKSAEKASASAS